LISSTVVEKKKIASIRDDEQVYGKRMSWKTVCVKASSGHYKGMLSLSAMMKAIEKEWTLQNSIVCLKMINANHKNAIKKMCFNGVHPLVVRFTEASTLLAHQWPRT